MFVHVIHQINAQRYNFFLTYAKIFVFLCELFVPIKKMLYFCAKLRMYHFTFFYIVLIYLAAINVVTFFLYGIDKLKAKRSKWRVKEATLIWMSVFGGSIGAWLGMKVWHHKTQHKKFKYGIPLILFAQIALVLLILYLHVNFLCQA